MSQPTVAVRIAMLERSIAETSEQIEYNKRRAAETKGQYVAGYDFNIPVMEASLIEQREELATLRGEKVLSSQDGALKYGNVVHFEMPRNQWAMRARFLCNLIVQKAEVLAYLRGEAAKTTIERRAKWLTEEALPYYETSICALLLELRGCVDTLSDLHITLGKVQAAVILRRALRNLQLEFMRAVDAEAYADKWLGDALALGINRANELRMQRDLSTHKAASVARQSTLAQAA